MAKTVSHLLALVECLLYLDMSSYLVRSGSQSNTDKLPDHCCSHTSVGSLHYCTGKGQTLYQVKTLCL